MPQVDRVGDLLDAMHVPHTLRLGESSGATPDVPNVVGESGRLGRVEVRLVFHEVVLMFHEPPPWDAPLWDAHLSDCLPPMGHLRRLDEGEGVLGPGRAIVPHLTCFQKMVHTAPPGRPGTRWRGGRG